MIKVVFIGCVRFSAAALRVLLEISDAEVVGVVTRKESRLNSDFFSLEPLAKRADVPCYFRKRNEEEQMAAWIEQRQPDIVFCFGWSHLLRKEVLSIPRMGVVGFHPAALPQNRGRHPLIWALALGLSETAATFFFMDQSADSGDILSQQPFAIAADDDAGTLYEKMTHVALAQIRSFVPRLADGSFERTVQDHTKANSWRKRGVLDGQIDWRMSARSVNNLVRALTRPYIGAHCIVEEQEAKVWKVQEVDDVAENFEPGRIVSVDGTRVVVKCGEAAVVLLEHEIASIPAVGEYI